MVRLVSRRKDSGGGEWKRAVEIALGGIDGGKQSRQWQCEHNLFPRMLEGGERGEHTGWGVGAVHEVAYTD
jgi:hypothetical protein